MNNIATYFLANTYSASSPMFNAAMSVCMINEQVVPCPNLNFIGPVILVVGIFMIVSVWKIFLKANQPGWASIVPIYNALIWLRVVKKPDWWIILLFIPFVGMIIGLIVTYESAKVFGKGLGFTIGLLFLPFIFLPILAFGNSKYISNSPPNNQLNNQV